MGSSRVQGQCKVTVEASRGERITCQLGKLNVKNDECQSVRTWGGQGSAG